MHVFFSFPFPFHPFLLSLPSSLFFFLLIWQICRVLSFHFFIRIEWITSKGFHRNSGQSEPLTVLYILIQNGKLNCWFQSMQTEIWKSAANLVRKSRGILEKCSSFPCLFCVQSGACSVYDEYWIASHLLICDTLLPIVREHPLLMTSLF